MPEWLEITVMLLAPALSGYIGVKVGLAVVTSQIADAREEIKALRQAKHDHAGVLTQHEMRLESLERKVDPR